MRYATLVGLLMVPLMCGLVAPWVQGWNDFALGFLSASVACFTALIAFIAYEVQRIGE